MQSEPLTEQITLTLTQREKEMLLKLCQEHGATMRGFIRKLIRDAANRYMNTEGVSTDGSSYTK